MIGKFVESSLQLLHAHSLFDENRFNVYSIQIDGVPMFVVEKQHFPVRYTRRFVKTEKYLCRMDKIMILYCPSSYFSSFLGPLTFQNAQFCILGRFPFGRNIFPSRRVRLVDWPLRFPKFWTRLRLEFSGRSGSEELSGCRGRILSWNSSCPRRFHWWCEDNTYLNILVDIILI